MRNTDEPHEPGCLGNHRGDCAVSGYFDPLREFVLKGQAMQAAVDEIIGEATSWESRATRAERQLADLRKAAPGKTFTQILEMVRAASEATP